MFDVDGDELLSRDELVRAAGLLVDVRENNLPHTDSTVKEEVRVQSLMRITDGYTSTQVGPEELADQALQTHGREKVFNDHTHTHTHMYVYPPTHTHTGRSHD